jgi:serine/threonine-protein kinase
MSTGPPKLSSTKLGRFQMPRPGDVLEGRYEITKVLATGGMGVILQATHVRMGREVAVKILHPHIAQEDHVVARFEREVRLAQLLNHPNTIRLYDFGEAENGLVYVVMELLDGADLKEIIAEEGTLPLGRAVDLTMQVLDGLGEAHEQDFVHRDLKPSNIFVIKDRRGADEVKILDFGIAKSLEEGNGDLTATGSICGTAAYVAPEYLHDPTPKKAADVYAVGLILLEMLTGQRAFHGTTTAQTLMMQLQREVQVPRQLAATPLGEIIARAVSKDPAGRYQTADAMFQALGAVVDELPADLRLRTGQVGELLRPPTGSITGTAELPSGSHDQRQDSSTRLPQAGHTPPSGEHSSPEMDAMDGDATLVTPFPAPLQSSNEIPLRAPDYSGAPDDGREGTSHDWNKILAITGGVAVVLAAVVAVVFLTGPGDGDKRDGDGTESPIAIGSTDELPQPGAEATPSADPAAVVAVDEAVESEADESGEAGAVEFRIESLPPAATVLDDGDEIGQTPLSHTFEGDQLPRTLHLELDGFEEATLELSAESDKSQQVMLIEIDEPEQRPSTEKPTPSQPKPSGSTSRPNKAPEKQSNRWPAKSSDKPDKSKDGEENVDEFLDEYL